MIAGRDSRRRYILLVIVLTCVTLITLDQRAEDKGPVGALGRLAHRVVSPIASAAHDVFAPIGDWFAGLTDGGELREQNRELRRRVAELETEVARNESALEQYEVWSRLFGEVWLDDIPSVPALVTSGSVGNFERTVVLNKGTESGIRVGYAVVGEAGLVGRVVEAWSGGSKVELVTQASFGVAVRLTDQRIKGPAEVTGRSGVLSLNLSSADLTEDQLASIVVGDLVETCGCDGSAYPPGIPVGTVESVEQQQSGISVIVRIRPSLDRPSLEAVRVLRWDPGDAVPEELEATTTTEAPAETGSTTSTAGDGDDPGDGSAG